MTLEKVQSALIFISSTFCLRAGYAPLNQILSSSSVREVQEVNLPKLLARFQRRIHDSRKRIRWRALQQ